MEQHPERGQGEQNTEAARALLEKARVLGTLQQHPGIQVDAVTERWLRPCRQSAFNCLEIAAGRNPVLGELQSFVFSQSVESAEALTWLPARLAKQVLKGVDRDSFDMVDAIVASNELVNLVTRQRQDPRFQAADDRELQRIKERMLGIVSPTVVHIADAVRLVQGVSLGAMEEIVGRLYIEFPELARWHLTTAFADNILLAHEAMTSLGEIRFTHSERKRVKHEFEALVRQLSALGAHRIKPLMVRGVSLGLLNDITIAHPTEYLPSTFDPKLCKDVVADFFLLSPRDVHQPPRPSAQGPTLIDLPGEDIAAALRLFRDGSVDYSRSNMQFFSWRPIDGLLRQLPQGESVTLYLKGLLASLAFDALAPARVVESVGGTAQRQAAPPSSRERPAERMGHLLIPRVAHTKPTPEEPVEAILQRWEEAEQTDSRDAPTRRRPGLHDVRAYARRVPRGSHQRPDNLADYLRDVEAGVVQLSPEDDADIRAGRKLYMHAVEERGSEEEGRIVGRWAQLGGGATRQFLEGMEQEEQ